MVDGKSGQMRINVRQVYVKSEALTDPIQWEPPGIVPRGRCGSRDLKIGDIAEVDRLGRPV